MSDASELGREAYFRGDDLDMNPYDERDAQHDEWDDGYGQAKFSDTEDDGWQPIEKVPYGEVLLWVKAAGLMRCMVGHKMEGGHSIEDHPPIDGGWYFWNGWQFTTFKEQPVAWKPLPDGPAKSHIFDQDKIRECLIGSGQ